MYFNHPKITEPNDKAIQIIRNFNDVHPLNGYSFEDVPKDRGLFCVLVNGMFDAVYYVKSYEEFEILKSRNDYRQKAWLTMPIETIEQLIEDGYIA